MKLLRKVMLSQYIRVRRQTNDGFILLKATESCINVHLFSQIEYFLNITQTAALY